MPSRLERGIRRRIEIDSRALAAFRVLAAVLLAADVLLRSRNLRYFYSDEGVVSTELARAVTAEHAFSVFYLLPGEPAVTAAVFGLGLLVALQLALGYRTRLATLLAFLFVVSVNHRNYFVLSYSDALFALLLFWAAFLPLGERWSVDALHRDRAPRDSYAGFASAFVLLQMVSMYLVNGLQKTRSELWLEGDAVGVILASDELTYLLGNHVGVLPDGAFTVATYLWFGLTLTSPALVLLTGRRRSTLASLYVAGHLSLAPLVRIGAFSFVASAGLLLFLHPGFWDEFERLVRSRAEGAVNAASRLRRYCAERLPEVSPGAWVDDRYLDAISVLSLVALLVFGGGMVASNVATGVEAAGLVDDSPPLPGQDRVSAAAEALGVDQPPWDVFAPEVKDKDVYYVFAAESSTGDVVDLWSGGEVDWRPPYTDLSRQYDRSYRERFYMDSVWMSPALALEGAAPEVELAEHLCDAGGDVVDGEVERLHLYHVIENVEGSGDGDGRNALSMFEHSCDPDDVKPRPVLSPPPEFGPVVGGHERGGGSSLVDRRPGEMEAGADELSDGDRCPRGFEELEAAELNRGLKHLERGLYVDFGEAVTSVGVHTLDLAEYDDGYRFLYHVRVYTTETGVHEPRFYVVEYSVTEDGVRRRILESTAAVEGGQDGLGHLGCPREIPGFTDSWLGR